jgi:hypothetical protein
MYEIHLECGDVLLRLAGGQIGTYRYCRNCESMQRIHATLVMVSNVMPLPVKLVKSAKWTDSLTLEELDACFKELMKGYHKITRLEKYEYAKYGKYNQIDYSFGTELFELTTDIITAGAW